MKYGSSQDADANFGQARSASFYAKCEFKYYKSCEQKQPGRNPFLTDRTDTWAEKSLSKAV